MKDISKEGKDRICTCGNSGGLILAPSNEFTDDVPIENILWFYDTVRDTKAPDILKKLDPKRQVSKIHQFCAIMDTLRPG
ncbi:MAG: hypothetical protein JSV25_07405 [Spirochaetota bacterium]|nr:MAG: hypothetical protein JSV25_07405 [Spirochaetota bacterium]